MLKIIASTNMFVNVQPVYGFDTAASSNPIAIGFPPVGEISIALLTGEGWEGLIPTVNYLPDWLMPL